LKDYIPIPVEEAKVIAEDFKKSMVIILAYDPVHQVTHTTTYGVSPFDKENAAAAGCIITKAIGADLSKKQDFEDFPTDYDAANYKAALEVMQKIMGRNDGSPWAISQIETILKAAGKHPRRG
jgi:hypothetical protein